MIRPITAEDIRCRDRERIEAWIAIQAKFYAPLIKRTFEIMRERGLIPKEPNHG
jgi:hypothetical protein